MVSSSQPLIKKIGQNFHLRQIFNITLGLIFLFCTAVAAHYLWAVLRATTLNELLAAISVISPTRFVIAFVIVVCCYIIITGYDLYGMRFAGSKLAFKKIAPVAFMGDAINANTPFSSIAGSVIKLRLYLKAGENPKTIIKAIAAYTFAYWSGFCTLLAISGTAMMAAPRSAGSTIPLLHQYLFTVIAFLISLFYLVVCRTRIRLLPPRLNELIPTGTLGMRLLGIGICDWFLSTLAFFVLMPGGGALADLPRFINTYLIAHALGIISQLPGGIGVFESTCLYLNPLIAPAAMLGSLLVFRMLFFIMPLLAALLLLAITEARGFFRRHQPQVVSAAADTSNSPSARTGQPDITVVVPAFNEHDSLPGCLKALTRQNYSGKYEIVVVDNASIDDTAAIALRFGCRVIREPVKGYNRAVKTGFDSAQGEIIACTDADTIVKPDWLSHIARRFEDRTIIACGGIFRFHDGPAWLRAIGFVFGRLNYHIAGANMAVRSDAYHRIGGFSLDVNQGADVDLGMRLKKLGTVLIDRSLVVATSSRRFASAFWKTIFSYYINDIFLLLFKRPVFYSFADFRTLAAAGLPRRWLMPTVMTPLFIVCLGWFMELPFNQMLGTVLAKGPKVKAVALTFDDGPGNSTAAILDILRSHGAKATFFVIGKNAVMHPELLRRMVADGHEIGNHSYTHSIRLAIEAPSSIKKEIDTTASIIRHLTGLQPTDFRPPHGWRTPWTLRTCHHLGYETVLWTIDSQDWLHVPHDRICSNVYKKVKPGAIILFHDRLNIGDDHGIPATVEALPGILDSLSHLGYTFVTIDEMKTIPRHENIPVEYSLGGGASPSAAMVKRSGTATRAFLLNHIGELRTLFF